MSYQEKKTLMSLITGVLILVSYCLYAFGKVGMAHMNDLQFWARTILVFIGIGIIALIVIQIVFHILMAVTKAVQQKMKDETIDDKEIERSLECEMVEDEMDKLIELKTNRIGYSAMGVGFVAGLIAITFGASAVALINIIFLTAWVGSFIEGLMQIRYYRKGIR
jgi:fumarate reductase subunit C